MSSGSVKKERHKKNKQKKKKQKTKLNCQSPPISIIVGGGDGRPDTPNPYSMDRKQLPVVFVATSTLLFLLKHAISSALAANVPVF